MRKQVLYEFRGELDESDCKRHIPHPFTVPPNCSEIDVSFRFVPERAGDIHNLLTLTLFDPHGFRGAGHRDGPMHQVHLGALDATPGYCPGEISPGEWVVQIDTHMIVAGQVCRYTLQISGSDPAPEGTQAAARRPRHTSSARASRRPGWYRGDLHTHTIHSDGWHSVASLVQAAHDQGLDFLALTDHNTISGLEEVYTHSSPGFVTMGGLELTTFWGHALSLGAREWIDWRVGPGEGEMARLASEAYGRGETFVIAHPCSVGDPVCTGCRWLYPDMMPGAARLVEVWNGPWGGDSGNEGALALWYDWLNRGCRIVATAGTDIHGEHDYARNPGFSVVYADSLSEEGLLRAVHAGHAYLSSGPRLEFSARTMDGREAIMGDDVLTDSPTFTVRWDECPPGAAIRIVEDGQVVDGWPGAGRGRREWVPRAGRARWRVAEIRGTDGAMLAVTNPIFS